VAKMGVRACAECLSVSVRHSLEVKRGFGWRGTRTRRRAREKSLYNGGKKVHSSLPSQPHLVCARVEEWMESFITRANKSEDVISRSQTNDRGGLRAARSRMRMMEQHFEAENRSSMETGNIEIDAFSPPRQSLEGVLEEKAISSPSSKGERHFLPVFRTAAVIVSGHSGRWMAGQRAGRAAGEMRDGFLPPHLRKRTFSQGRAFFQGL